MAVKVLIAKIPPRKQKYKNHFTIFQKISEHLTILLNISNTPILTLARFPIYPSIQSWHLFRKSKSERVYKILREYWLRRITIIMIFKIVLGKKENL